MAASLDFSGLPEGPSDKSNRDTARQNYLSGWNRKATQSKQNSQTTDTDFPHLHLDSGGYPREGFTFRLGRNTGDAPTSRLYMKH